MWRIIKFFWVSIILFIIVFTILYKIIFAWFCNFYSLQSNIWWQALKNVNECQKSLICEVKKIEYNKKYELQNWSCWRKNIILFN